MSIANLPWYDLPEFERETNALWTGIARHLRAEGVDAPDCLDRETDYDAQWHDPNLLFSQACGYDVLYDEAPHLSVIATPRYSAKGCHGANYRSAIIVRDDHNALYLKDLRGLVAVINNASSHSGNNVLRAMVAPLSQNGRFFRQFKVSGSHTQSLAMLTRGEADVACIDVVVWEMYLRTRPRLVHGMRCIMETPSAPAPPYVTSRHISQEKLERIRAALFNAMSDPQLAMARQDLLIDGVELLPHNAYDELTLFEDVAKQHGYYELPAPKSSPLYRNGHL